MARPMTPAPAIRGPMLTPIEESMIKDTVIDKEADKIAVRFSKTERNQPVENFLEMLEHKKENGSYHIDKEQVIDVDQLKQFKANRFEFSPEKIFYEDVRRPFISSFKSKEISPIIDELDGLLENLIVLHFNEMHLKLKQFFLNNYKKGDKVKLLHFYESFY